MRTYDRDYEEWCAEREAGAWAEYREELWADQERKDTARRYLIRRRGEIPYSDWELERQRDRELEEEYARAWEAEREDWERRT